VDANIAGLATQAVTQEVDVVNVNDSSELKVSKASSKVRGMDNFLKRCRLFAQSVSYFVSSTLL
jgi:hypothetical protein